VRLVLVSDTHGRKDFAVPDGDALLHCGDFTMSGKLSEVKSFDKWLGTLRHRHKIVIAGNHDFAFHRTPRLARESLKNGIYLQDSSVRINDSIVYGSPWQPWFNDWAFNLPRGPELAAKWDRIPNRADILMTHGPPRGILDRCPDGEQVGCDDLLVAIERVKPALHVFGHIHCAAGTQRSDSTLFVNASICDEDDRAVQSPVVVDLQCGVATVVSPEGFARSS
jgi:predicted phosphohydrolase